MAAYAHAVGTSRADDWTTAGVANVALGWIAIIVIARPDRGLARTALAGAVVASALLEAPLLGNHWLLAAMVSTAALIVGPWREDAAFVRGFAPTARLILLSFYSFAALAKYNTGFLDPVESCARFFANQTLGFWNLPEVGGDGAVAWLLVVSTLIIETSIPILLIVRRTRLAGVWLALIFHLALTLDLRQHFYDFTMVLIPLFLLFAGPALLEAVDRALPRLRLGGGRPWMLLAGLHVAAYHLPVGDVAFVMAVVVSWAVWLLLFGVLAFAFFGAWRQGAGRPVPDLGPGRVAVHEGGLSRWSRAGLAGVVALVVLNGLAPYLELKTATGFNMYANLYTVDGETNHLLVPRTARLRADQSDLVEILDTNSDGLAEYINSGFVLPASNLGDYLFDNPGATVTYQHGDEVLRWPATDDAGGLSAVIPSAQPWWQERFALFRAVPTQDQPPCQNAWLVAR